MDTNCYDIRRMPETICISPDGITISKLVAHPIRRTTELSLIGLGSDIEEGSIRVISQTSTVAAHYTVHGLVQGQAHKLSEHRVHDDYRVHIILKPQDKNQGIMLPESGNIDLVLNYTTRRAFWIPRYILDISGNGDACLLLQAVIIPRPTDLENTKIVLANYSAVSEHLKTTQSSNIRVGGQTVPAPSQQSSRFVQRNWFLPKTSQPCYTLAKIQITGVLMYIATGSKARPTRFTARHDTGVGSLPTGEMQLLLEGNFVKSFQIPTWNPGEPLDIDLGNANSDPALTEFKKASIPDILNPMTNEKSSYQISQVKENPETIARAEYQDSPLCLVDRSHIGSNTATTFSSSATNPNSPRLDDFGDEGCLELTTKSAKRNRLHLDPHHLMRRRRMPSNTVLLQHSPREEAAKTLEELHRNPRAFGISKEKLRPSTSSKIRASTRGGPSQALPIEPKPAPVDIMISKQWRDSMTYEWVTSDCRWKTLQPGRLDLIEVFIDNKAEPIHLSPWGEHRWAGRLCDGSRLTVEDNEVTRLVEKGGSGSGLLHWSPSQIKRRRNC